jgi:phenylpropionate dioxygenase-like ring-hydroxylating dioxygenase large terminal subunit
LCGFGYDVDGRCVSVPTQSRVPLGACVASYPVQEADGLVWAWIGEPGRARLHRIAQLPWLVDGTWATVGGQAVVAAGFLLLHENFADVTQVPVLAPQIAPSVLEAAPPDDFAVGDATADATLAAVFGGYYERVVDAMAAAQQVLDLDGPGPEVNVSADVAGLKVREIVAAMLAEQTEGKP